MNSGKVFFGVLLVMVALSSIGFAYNLTLAAIPPNGGSVFGSATGLTNGSVRAITAAPNSGWNFTMWTKSGSCTVANVYNKNTTVTVNGNCYVYGNFVQMNQSGNNTTVTYYTLTVSANPSNGGTVTGSATGLTNGSVRAITAAPNSGWNFTMWTKSGSCTVANVYNKN
ncbi:MAG: hypothetical protein QW568_03715, partial [Candidatus Anstonellaceae archaeon]